jgi:hypothetical protein
MGQGSDSVQQRLLILGLFQVLVGCIVGFIPPPAVLHFRAVVTAHIEFCVNGTLLAVIGLCVPRMNLSNFMLWLMQATAVVGTFTNGGAFVISAFTGFGTKLGPTINEKFPPPKGIEGGYSDAITGILMVCGVCMLVCLSIAVVGLVRYRAPKEEKAK